MLIGIDARMYGPGQGGLGRYIEQLIKHLEQIDRSNDYVIFLRRDNFDNYRPQNPKFKKVLADIAWYGVAEQFKLKKIIRREKVDFMHFPHWNVPLGYNDPFVVTVHDLILLHYPTRRASTKGFFTYWFKNFIWKLVLKNAVKKSIKIITPSEFTKQDLIKTLNVPADKISVTCLAPTPQLNGIQPPVILSEAKRSEESLSGHELGQRSFAVAQDDKTSTVLKNYKITKPYLLYVGVAYPHKNLETLLAAWKIFMEKFGTGYQLVLAGKKNYFYERLIKLVAKEKINNVIFTDFIPDQDLPALYQNASLYVFPSLYEGFGLPPLEAMSYNLPVASSAASCLPEILKDAAIFFDPHDKIAMAQAINLGLNDQNLRQKLLENGQKLLKTYSWNKTAAKTLNLYQNSV